MAIYSAKAVKQRIQEQEDMEVTQKTVRQVMRKDLHMGYRLARTVPVQGNSERCLVLR